MYVMFVNSNPAATFQKKLTVTPNLSYRPGIRLLNYFTSINYNTIYFKKEKYFFFQKKNCKSEKQSLPVQQTPDCCFSQWQFLLLRLQEAWRLFGRKMTHQENIIFLLQENSIEMHILSTLGSWASSREDPHSESR
jgi:hypothetical protein